MRGKIGAVSEMVITHQAPMAMPSEAFRVLRTNLQFMSLDKPLKTIMVTSATPGEGKTTTAANLAVAFAQTGASVCLIDADLRRPMVAKTFGVDNWSGLTSALIGQTDLDVALKQCAVPGLTLLPSGPVPPNPAELVGSNKMSKLLADLSERFEMVIIDTPPVLAVTDAAVLAPKADGVVMVVRSGKVDYRLVNRAKDALLAVKANLLGVVLDGVEAERGEGYYYYYQSADGEKAGRR